MGKLRVHINSWSNRSAKRPDQGTKLSDKNEHTNGLSISLWTNT